MEYIEGVVGRVVREQGGAMEVDAGLGPKRAEDEVMAMEGIVKGLEEARRV